MLLPINVGQHFTCLVLSGASVDPQLGACIDLGDGIWAVRRRFFDMTPSYNMLFWKPSFEDVQANNLFLVVVAPPGDEVQCEGYWSSPLEERLIEERLTALVTGLGIQGVPVFAEAHRFSACRLPTGIRLHSIEPISRFSDDAELPLTIRSEQLHTASRIGGLLRSIFAPPLER